MSDKLAPAKDLVAKNKAKFPNESEGVPQGT